MNWCYLCNSSFEFNKWIIPEGTLFQLHLTVYHAFTKIFWYSSTENSSMGSSRTSLGKCWGRRGISEEFDSHTSPQSPFVTVCPVGRYPGHPLSHRPPFRSEMSRVSDASYHKLMTAPICTLNSLVLQKCSPSIPSTATTAHIPGKLHLFRWSVAAQLDASQVSVADLTSSIACSLLSCTIPTATVISPPPPYHSINHHRTYQHNIHPLFDMHSAATVSFWASSKVV